MKMKRILLVIVVIISLCGCTRELPSGVEVKDYISNKFIGGYELKYEKDEFDTKGYQKRYYTIRLRNLYSMPFKVICSSKENISNLSGISDTFSGELRKLYFTEKDFKYEIEKIGDYEYHVNIDSNLDSYENIHSIIRYIIHCERMYLRYENSFYVNHSFNNFLYGRILESDKYRRINTRLLLKINNKFNIRLWEYEMLSYDESKLKYENDYKIFSEKGEENETDMARLN